MSFRVSQCVCIEQLTLDFEYLINEVIRNDAEWGGQFCSFSDYDVVILEVREYVASFCVVERKCDLVVSVVFHLHVSCVSMATGLPRDKYSGDQHWLTVAGLL